MFASLQVALTKREYEQTYSACVSLGTFQEEEKKILAPIDLLALQQVKRDKNLPLAQLTLF